MGEASDAIGEAIEKAHDSRLNTVVAVAVSVTATFMALCNVKDGNVVQAMAQAQASSVDQWAYYQSKSTKQHIAEAVVDQLGVQRELAGSPEARATLDRKIAEYQGRAKKDESEKVEIKRTAEELSKKYDELNNHDDQFDMAEAGMTVAIALFGVTALTQRRSLLAVACVFAGFGALMGLAGFLGLNLHPDWLAKLLS
jgi:hypothetical protein